MRRLTGEINDYSDIYHPVEEDDIRYVEGRLGFTFPDDYRRFVLHPDVATMRRLPDVLWFVHHPTFGILEVNASLQESEFRPFPEDLIAFASNGCGDYFCFPRGPGKIVYIDPDYSIEENLASTDGLVYDSFGDWLRPYPRGCAEGYPSGRSQSAQDG